MGKSKNLCGTPETTATPPTYLEAVQLAMKLIDSGFEHEFAVSERVGKVFFAFEDVLLTQYGFRILRERPENIQKLSESDAYKFDAIRYVVSTMIDRGEKLPMQAKEWLIKFLRGEINRPANAPGAPPKDWLHILIWIAVGNLVEGGMTATRNDASAKVSACDAVADAMAELRFEPSTFHGVKRVWQNMKKKEKVQTT